MDVGGDNLQHLYFLLEFLVAWEERPVCLTPMVYKWCPAFSEVAEVGPPSGFEPQFKQQTGNLDSQVAEQLFLLVGPCNDPGHMGDISIRYRLRALRMAKHYPKMLPMVLRIGFRLVVPGHNLQALRLDHTPYHNLVFKHAFSSDDDEVVADGVCAWIADTCNMPDGSCVHHLAQRMEKDTPFSPRLQQMGIRLIECTWRSELRVSGLETICLLNHLNVSMDDIEDSYTWAEFLMDVICSPLGLGGLPIHYWHLLEGILPALRFYTDHLLVVVRPLEEAEDWEKLEAWLVIVWQNNPVDDLENLKQETLKLLQQRPSALPRFEELSRSERIHHNLLLKGICAQVQTQQSPSEPPSL